MTSSVRPTPPSGRWLVRPERNAAHRRAGRAPGTPPDGIDVLRVGDTGFDDGDELAEEASKRTGLEVIPVVRSADRRQLGPVAVGRDDPHGARRSPRDPQLPVRAETGR